MKTGTSNQDFTGLELDRQLKYLLRTVHNSK